MLHTALFKLRFILKLQLAFIIYLGLFLWLSTLVHAAAIGINPDFEAAGFGGFSVIDDGAILKLKK